ncbi:uncharacterized protein FOMMEDRAFT_162489 [Fomitiporia mediterranea MF3/22]|uniref:uncharacterized protein n=1 Tax=Fomitiporia mediterranea (strain MF3/22) TaxID=694068 RepID=UPI0004408CEF|nr:uncharacterized protein FOMMEDRAFT_162489 [Fomitiporia mediterranea MF3/22]EJC98136.1 hypothetical protein FOMMEDRAFT_162489 [Fomitiporia mediterranea MF3/22]
MSIWMTLLSDLSIELSDRTVDVTVPPLEAVIIELFSSKDTWSVDELSNKLHVESVAVRKGLDTWVDHVVLSETDTNVFVLLEEAYRWGLIGLVAHVMEQEPVVSPAQQQEAEQMRVYWKFIEGMLTNIDRIQTMLKFAPNYSRTIEQLSVFMEAARREGLVTVNNGLWKLNR